ncbi:biotin/lipoyl-binding protein [Flavobacterium sp. 3HN19-14]|uniref:biotin/lipoyl-binding protein n=1 Tax=Flavobacterium sp. 3HN19-14 TaxID=3448133 RepID=UPI003EDFA03B
MKKILLLSAFSLLLLSCSKEKSVDELIASKDQKAMQEKRTALQADIAKLDGALGAADNKKPEALVSIAAVKDTTFSHYLEIQGNVDTKDNLIIYPQFSGILTTLNVKAGQSVTKGQVLGRIDDGGLSQQVAQLETQAALAKTTFERQKRLCEPENWF